MPKIHFSDRTIAALPNKPDIYWDASANPPAFGIRTGKLTKTFVVVMQGGRRIKLGKYPALSLQEARLKAKQILAHPTAPKEEKALKLRDAMQEFLEHNRHANKERTTREYRRLLERHVLSKHPNIRVDQLTTADILKITDALLKTPTEAIHTHAALKTFYAWAVRRTLVSSSPIAQLPLPARLVQRDRVLTDDELARVYGAAQKMDYPFGSIVLLCIHTLMRRSNVGALRWSYISDNEIAIPADQMKSGMTFSLPNLIGEKLKKIPKTCELLFPSSAGTPFSAWSKNKDKLDRLSGVSNYVLHDLRRTGASKLAEWRIAQPHLIERILGHATGQSMTPLARVYNRHSYSDEVRECMIKYEARLAALIST